MLVVLPSTFKPALQQIRLLQVTKKMSYGSSSYSGTPVNTVTNGPKKFGHDNELTVLTRVSLQENVWLFLPGDQ